MSLGHQNATAGQNQSSGNGTNKEMQKSLNETRNELQTFKQDLGAHHIEIQELKLETKKNFTRMSLKIQNLTAKENQGNQTPTTD